MLRNIAGAAIFVTLLVSCKAVEPKPPEAQPGVPNVLNVAAYSRAILPPDGWKAEGRAFMPVKGNERGRIYLTGEGSGSVTTRCSENIDSYPYLMVRMYDSLPGATWEIFVEKDGRKVSLVRTVEEGEWLLPLKEKTGWSGKTDFTLGIGMEGRKGDWIVFDYINLVKFDETVPEAPVLTAPAEKMAVRPFAVQFMWKQVKNAVGYELQCGRSSDLESAPVQKIVSPFISDYLWQLPENELEAGDWFWRIRAVNVAGASGPWSETGAFRVTGQVRPASPQRKISTEEPLPVLFCDAKEVRSSWESLPEVIRQRAYLRVEALPIGELEAACRVAEAHKIPILVQVSGPHDFYGTTSSRVSLSQVERFFQKFTMVKGAFICEQACQNGGLRNPNVWRYMDRLIRLSADYGRLTVWADGHWGRYQWLDLAANSVLFETVRRNRANFVPVWKMNCGVTPYSLHGSLLGLWLSGSVDNWGVEPENWYWFEAGFSGPDEQKWFKEGDPGKMPPSFYAQMLMLGLISGASVYVLEPPSATWEKPGVLSPHWTENLLPIMQKIVTDRIVPDREEVWSLVTDAIALNEMPVWRADYDDDLRPFYEELCRPKSIFDCLPKTGAYPAPVFVGPEIDREFGEKLRQVFASVTERGQKSVFRKKAGARPEERCIFVKGKNATFAMNSFENAKSSQDYSCELTGAFKSLSGQLRTNEYFIVQQKLPRRVDLLLRLSPGDSKVLVAFGEDVKAPPVVDLGGTALNDFQSKWDPETRSIELKFRWDRGGTLPLTVTAR